jgi:DNA-binding winged helix-turn-helix (wHTH) protein
MTESTSELIRPLQEIFSLGSWQVDPDLNQLIDITDSHKRRTLEPRLMHLLCLLAANTGRTVTREQLIGELWPRVIVNENSLTRAISELRKRLATPQRTGTDYLQTIPKKGYRLSFPVKTLAAAEQVKPTAPEAERPSSPIAQSIVARRRPLQLAACLVLAVLVIRDDYPDASPGLPDVALDDVIFDQVIDTGPGIVGGRLSPSSLDDNGNPAASTAFNTSAALSPDGSILAFVRQQGNRSTIFLARTGVGASADPLAIYSTEGFLYNLTWSPVGKALLFARQESILRAARLNEPGQGADLMMLDLDSLSLRVLIDHNPEASKPAAV